jgi:hypothetical protein
MEVRADKHRVRPSGLAMSSVTDLLLRFAPRK